MSNVIEDRIVEMKFDNSNFERNVATSMNTLDRLKNALNFSKSGESLKELGKAANEMNDISFNGISESLSAIQDRFSTMGIVGMTIIQNLTSSALSAIANVGSKFFGMISSGGISRAMNIEKAKFQLEGLGIAYQDVYDEIDYAVTNTSFSLDAAAQAAAQLSSAGLDYNDVIFVHEKDQKAITEMGMALRAVSGVAAQTMSDYSMVARYFQDVANAGKVTGATLTYMTQVLNLPVKQDLAEGLMAIADGSYEATEAVRKNAEKLVGNMEISAQDVEEFCKKSQIDFDTFSTIMFNKYADHAVEANKTLTGVIDNIKSAFARIGAEFVTPIVEIDGAVVHMLDSFRKKVNEFKGYIVPFAKLTTDSINTVARFMDSAFRSSNIKWVEPFFTGLGGVIKGITWILLEIGETFRKVFPSSLPDRLLNLGEKFRDFGKAFGDTYSKFTGLNKVSRIFDSFFNLLKAGGSILKIFTEPFKSFITAFRETTNTAEISIDSIISAMDKLAEMINTSEKIKQITDTMSNIGRILGQTFRGIVNGVVTAVQSLRSGGIKGLVDDIFNHLFREMGDGIIYLAELLTGKDLSDAFSSFNKGIDKLREFFSKFIDVAQSGVTNIKEFIAQLKENLGTFHIDTSGFKDFVDGIVEDMNPLDKILTFVTNAFRSMAKFLASIVPGILTIGKGLVSGVKSIIEGVWNALKGENLGEGVETALGAAFLYNLKNVFIQLRKIVNLFLGKQNPASIIDNFITELTIVFDQAAKSLNANYFMTLAGALLVLAFAMSVIAGIDSDRLADATAVIVGLVAEMALVAKSLRSYARYHLPDGASALVMMAIAVSILASAIKKVADIEDPDKLVMATIAIEALIGSMYLVAKKLSSAKPETMMKGASGLIAMALAVRILASAAKVFAKMDWEELGKAGAAIGALILALGAFIKFTGSRESHGLFGSKFKSFSADNMISIGIGLMALAAAVKILASAAKDFAGLEWEELAKAGAAITVLMAELTIFTRVTSDSSKMVSIGVSLIAIAASMKIFASAANDFAKVPWEGLGKAGSALTAIVAAVVLLSKLTSMNSSAAGFFTDSGGFVKSAQSQNLIQLGVGLIAFAAAMKIFASAAQDFGYLDWEDLGKSGAALAGLLAGLSLFAHFTDSGNLLKLSGSLMVFSVALLTLVPAVKGISNIGIVGLIATLGAIAGMIFILGKAAQMTESVQGGMLKLSAALLLFGAALAAVGLGLTLLSAGVTSAVAIIPAVVLLIKETILAVIHTVSEAIPLIVETLFKLVDEILNSLEDHVPEIVDSFLNIFIKIINVLASRMSELTGAIGNLVSSFINALGLQIDSIDPMSLIAGMVGIAAFMVILAETAKIAQKNIAGVAAIMAVLAEVALMFILLSGIDAETTLAIAEGISVTMVALGATMFIISKVPFAAAAQGVAGLAVVIAGLTGILAALGAIRQIPGVSWLLDEGTKVLGQIGTAIGEFVGNIISGFAEGLTSQLPQIGQNLSDFMINATPFLEGAKLIDQKAMDGVVKLAGVILALTAADIINGLTSWFTGGTSFAKFGQQLAEFAPYFADYYETIKEVKPDVVEASANAALALAKMASTLPKQGGVAQWFTGKGSISEFAEQLKPFGRAMVEYSKSVADLDVTVVEKSVAAAKSISELANNLPNSGGVVGWFMGENDMDKFGEQLVIFGKKLAAYSVYVANIDPSVVEKSVAAGKAIAELANNLPNTGGMISWFTGDNDMGKFGAQLTAFGYALSDYSQIVGGENGINADVIQKSVDAASALSALATGLPDSGGVMGWFFGDNDLQKFGEQLISFGTAMSEFSASIQDADLSTITDLTAGCTELINLATALQDIDTEVLKKFGKDANSFANQLTKVGGDGVQAFADAFINSSEIVIPAITMMIELMITELTNRIPDFRVKGGEFIVALGEGIKSKEYFARVAANSVCQAVVTVFSTNIYKDKFYQYGVYVAEGFAEGMESALGRVQDAAKKMIAAAEEATTAAAKIKSPSRLFRELGKYIPQGFALGMEDDTSYVEASAERMVKSSYDIMQNAIQSVFDSLDDSMNYNPVITPVIDLSSVNEDVGYINDLFNRSIAISGAAASGIVRTSNVSQLGNLQNGQLSGNGNIIFNQVNNSPKALSRIEIYRDTRNLFAQAKGALS